MTRDVRRTGEEPVTCRYFALCNEEQTDAEYYHPVLGWLPICESCARTVSLELPPRPSGWRVRVKFTPAPGALPRTETRAFMSPLRRVALANVRFNVELWHPRAEDIEPEIIGPVLRPEGSHWGSGKWTESFKSKENSNV